MHFKFQLHPIHYENYTGNSPYEQLQISERFPIFATQFYISKLSLLVPSKIRLHRLENRFPSATPRCHPGDALEGSHLVTKREQTSKANEQK